MSERCISIQRVTVTAYNKRQVRLQSVLFGSYAEDERVTDTPERLGYIKMGIQGMLRGDYGIDNRIRFVGVTLRTDCFVYERV